MKDRNDIVERALALLRDGTPAPEPDAGLEARLRARFGPRRRRRSLRLPLALLALGSSSVAFAAGGGVEWIRSWFYEVEVEGRAVAGTVGAEGERTIPFTTSDGTTGAVRLRTDRLADGSRRTRIDVDRAGDGRIEHDEAEDVFGDRPTRTLPLDALDGAVRLHAYTDPEGATHELFVTTGPGPLLLAWRAGADRVVEVARLPFDPLASGARAEITERDDGGLVLAFDDGRGAAFELVWNAARASAGVSELETPDGSVRVRLEPRSDDR